MKTGIKLFITIILAACTIFSGTATNLKQQTIKIAMAQIICLDGDRSGNLVRIENALIAAKKEKVDMIVFPESSLLGWENPEAFQRACPIPGKDSEYLCSLAIKYKIYICIGLDEKDGEKLYDSAIIIDDNGLIILKHRKINVLPELMNPPYSVGSGVQTVKTRFGVVGLMICADSFIDELIQSMKNQKPDFVFIPYGWAAVEKEWPVHGQELVKVVKNVATTIGCPVIGTNLVGQISNGPWKGQTYGGQSVAYNPENKKLVTGKDRDVELVIVNLNK